jgi:hypothetical protein
MAGRTQIPSGREETGEHTQWRSGGRALVIALAERDIMHWWERHDKQEPSVSGDGTV